jgi:hypothetical protein
MAQTPKRGSIPLSRQLTCYLGSHLLWPNRKRPPAFLFLSYRIIVARCESRAWTVTLFESVGIESSNPTLSATSLRLLSPYELLTQLN